MKKVLGYSIFLVCLCLFLLAFSACGTQVRFHLNFVVDGEIYDTIDTAGQEAISMPRNPTKEGYDFDGWYWDEGTWERPFTANSLLDTPLSSDLSVYAKWKSDDIPKVDPSAAEIVSAPAFEINGNSLSLTLPNATESYSFLRQITVCAGANWQVSTDMQGLNAIPTKTVPLNIGDNSFYLLVTSANGEGVSLYTVTIRRRPIYTVSFNANGGNSVTALRAEEDSTITPPSTTRTGYSFAGWDYDFAQPIKGNMTTAAKWTIIDYPISYVLEGGINAENNPTKYTIEDSVTLSAPTRAGYSFTGWSSDGEINIGSTGEKTFVAKWESIFSLNGGTIAGLTTYAKSHCNELIIPSEIDGTRIESIGLSAFSNCSGLTSIIIPDSITSIGNEAFENCSGLTSVTIPNSVTTIGQAVFSGCSSIQSITLPFVGGSKKTASDTYQYPLGYIFGTSSYTGGQAIEQWYYGINLNSTTCTTYYIPSSLKTVKITGGEILSGAFYNCSDLTSITMPDNVPNIGDYAFYYCTGLASIIIPNSVSAIGKYAFEGCSELTSIIIPDSVMNIGIYAFSRCTKLSSVIISHNVTSIKLGTFSYCSDLISVTIPDKVESIEGYTFFNCSSLSSVTISDNVLTIGYQAFGVCNNLQFNQYDSINYLGNESHPYLALIEVTDRAITSFTIHPQTHCISDYAFKNCSELSFITIPGSVTSIGQYAFTDCSSLSLIAIQNGVTNIGELAFANCTGLTSVIIPASITSIGDWAFTNCIKLASVTVPDSVETIGDHAFYNCSSLNSVILGKGVTSISYEAFANCQGLTSVTIPASITGIGDLAFANCTELTSVYYLGTIAEWKTIHIIANWNNNSGDYTIHCTDGDISK